MPRRPEVIACLALCRLEGFPHSRFVIWLLLRVSCGAWPANRTCVATLRDLAAQAGLSDREVRRACRDLESVGLLQRAPQRGGPNAWTLGDPYGILAERHSREFGLEVLARLKQRLGWADAATPSPRTSRSGAPPDMGDRPPGRGAPGPQSPTAFSAMSEAAAAQRAEREAWLRAWADRLAVAAGDASSARVYLAELQKAAPPEAALVKVAAKLEKARRAGRIINGGAYGLRLLRDACAGCL